MAPMGTGMLLCRGSYWLPPFIEGGTGSRSLELVQPSDLPDRLESGTPNTPGICGLRAGMELVLSRSPQRIARQESALMCRLYRRVKEVPRIRLYTGMPELERSAPVLSLNVEGYGSEKTAALSTVRDCREGRAALRSMRSPTLRDSPRRDGSGSLLLFSPRRRKSTAWGTCWNSWRKIQKSRCNHKEI